ncbi:MAG: DsrH/TusB family sulfur metabolism protein [Nitrososphaerales archaeon]|jgi:sulfur relay protein TusB/DsrH
MDEPFAEVGLAYARNDPGAQIVLIQDAVYLACKAGLEGRVYAVKDDVTRRGLTGSVVAGVEMVEYDKLVEMMENERVVCFL